MFRILEKNKGNFMSRQPRKPSKKPPKQESADQQIMARLFKLQQQQGIESRADFARYISADKDNDPISPQLLYNWERGERIGLRNLMRLKPTVRAQILFEELEGNELVQEGVRLAVAALQQALDREAQRLLGEEPKLSDLHRPAPPAPKKGTKAG